MRQRSRRSNSTQWVVVADRNRSDIAGTVTSVTELQRLDAVDTETVPCLERKMEHRM